MYNTRLENGRATADFSWEDDDDTMIVVIDVAAMRNSQSGSMSKRAARQFWNMLKEQGFKQCLSPT